MAYTTTYLLVLGPVKDLGKAINKARFGVLHYINLDFHNLFGYKDLQKIEAFKM